MKFTWSKIERPIIALAPMADMTDSPFCRIVKTLANPIIFREMVSAEAIVRENPKTWNMAAIDPSEHPLVQQLFGSNPAIVAEAARRLVENFAPEAIDLNMGCPVYKIISTFNGAALMKDPARAAEIVRAVKAAVSVPVSVKTRLGWNDPEEILNFAPRLEAAGADLLTIHGRTKTQGYTGVADWPMIGRAQSKIQIPVLANGDIDSAAKAQACLDATGAEGVLIGRGALGNPWIFASIEANFVDREYPPISLEERCALILRHLDLHLAHYGERGLVTFRKHLAWYFKGRPGSKKFREAMMLAQTRSELENLLQNLVLES